jgi:hypothetical protein
MKHLSSHISMTRFVVKKAYYLILPIKKSAIFVSYPSQDYKDYAVPHFHRPCDARLTLGCKYIH